MRINTHLEYKKFTITFHNYSIARRNFILEYCKLIRVFGSEIVHLLMTVVSVYNGLAASNT